MTELVDIDGVSVKDANPSWKGGGNNDKQHFEGKGGGERGLFSVSTEIQAV